MKTIKFFLIFFILITVFEVSYKLRARDYYKIPFPGQSLDEYSFSWVGLSLIELGYPVGFSGIKGYPFTVFRYINVDRIFNSGTAKGNPIAINYPWFDHPPTLGIITGGYAYLKGARVFEDTGTFLIRKPMLIFGIISVVLVFLTALFLYGLKEAIAASLIYATSPIVVIGSRMVQAENGIIPFFLASILFLILYFKKNKEFWLWIAAFCAGISSLFKLSGIIAIMSGIAIILLNKKNVVKELAIFLSVSLAFFSLFWLYGAIYNFKVFLNILKSNSSRFYGIGSNAFYSLLTSTKITNNQYLTDGWPLAGWVSLLIFPFLKTKEDQTIFMTTILYLGVYLLFGSEQYGWYHFPFYPLLTIAIARIFCFSFEDLTKTLLGFSILLIPIGLHISKIIDISNFQKFAKYWRISIFALILFFILPTLANSEKIKKISILYKAVLLIIFLFSIYLNIKYLLLINVDYWYFAT